MTNKYQKPLARNLGDIDIASGECVSGTIPTERCISGFNNIGPCSRGFTAGQSCITTGDAPGIVTNCVPGNQVTHCTSGFVAGFE